MTRASVVDQREQRRFLEQNQLPSDTTPSTTLDDPRIMPR